MRLAVCVLLLLASASASRLSSVHPSLSRLRGGDVLLRLRTKDGVKRVSVAGESPDVAALQAALQKQLKLPPERQLLSRRPGGGEPLDLAADGARPLSELGVVHGTVLHLSDSVAVDARASVAGKQAEAAAAGGGGGGGGGARRRKSVTMQQYMDERAEVEVVMKAPPPARCKFVSIDARASKDFADHVLALEFDEMRFALLYGASADGGGVRVDAFYEPPQRCTRKAIVLDDDDDAAAEAARAAAVAASLGLRVVGVAFAHPPRGALFKADELSRVAAHAAAAVDADADAADTFVVVKFRPVYDGEDLDGDVTAEVYQLTEQCAELAAKGALRGCKKPAGAVRLSPESGLELKSGADIVPHIDAQYFVSRVHDMTQPYTSPLRSGAFPHANRGFTVRKLHLKKYLQSQRDASVPFADVATDVQLLLYAATVLPPKEHAALCAAVAARAAGDDPPDPKAFGVAEALLCKHANLEPP